MPLRRYIFNTLAVVNVLLLFAMVGLFCLSLFKALTLVKVDSIAN